MYESTDCVGIALFYLMKKKKQLRSLLFLHDNARNVHAYPVTEPHIPNKNHLFFF